MPRTPWSELIALNKDSIPCPPASESLIKWAEGELGLALPEGLRDFYRTSNGLREEWWGEGIMWSLERAVADNLETWKQFEQEWPTSERLGLVEFADNGTRNPFCVPRAGGEQVWYASNIGDDVTYLTETVEAFWRGWVNSTLPHH